MEYKSELDYSGNAVKADYTLIHDKKILLVVAWEDLHTLTIPLGSI